MKAEAQISSWQATAYIVILILPTAILFVPATTAASAGPDAWLSLLAALVFGLLVAGIASALASRFPQETPVEYAPRLLGRYLGKLVGLIFACYFYYVAYFVQRQFTELMSTTYLFNTPVLVNIGLLTLIACYALYLGMEPLARTNTVITCFFLISIVVIFLLILKHIRLENFTPLLATPPGKILFGALSPGSWFGECAVILMLAPFLADKKKIARITFGAVLIVFFSMVLVTIGAVGLFGPETTSRLVFPTFSLARYTMIETFMSLDRVDVLFMAVWVAGMAFKLTTFFYAGTLAFAQLFGLKSYRPLIIPGGILLTVLSLNSWTNIAELMEFSAQVFPPSVSFVNFFLTFLLYLISFKEPSPGGQ
ncbi:GerAB/ArcD/ProY family transporter [Desulforamulus ruminis]|uniref:Spore germination protein n=1 Tax=Desulforamulus ruminis (strain ATCC 23193 / DSM 2154 / NCIMB 8452 / DL) TaxID=696281 RepID=F6DMD1_DESRL|nr:endospore germination permease [Desulforamulus ruminis]AEG60598.1 spore germination protein [Desulforamulus ruminis DSM 2154]